jgi:3-oxoacyl-[acyl-carrier protein] reductase
MRTIDLSDKTVLITGSSQGIGLATAQTFHAAGANVVINYFDDSEGLNAGLATAAVNQFSTRAIACSADVRNPEQLTLMMEKAASAFGSIDVLVNNAGVLRDRSFKKMSHDEWNDVIDTNLSGVFHTCQTALPHLAAGGAIVNVASLAAVTGFFGQANYAAAKAGVIALTKVLSKELAKQQIRVNAVAPGVVDTEMAQTIPEENRATMLQNVPLGRFAAPSEIADAILFLSSDLASYISGQTLHVNGGWWAA